MKPGLFAIILLQAIGLLAQTSEDRLPVVVSWEGQVLVLDSAYSSTKEVAPITFHAVKWYVGQFTFWKGEEILSKRDHSYHLLDVEVAESLFIPLAGGWPEEADRLRFTLGVDSLTSASGVYGGDLDPMHGMYWTWQSGYIHAKVEGESPACPARKNRFQFHLGGYQAPFPASREIEVSLPAKGRGRLVLALDQFLQAIDLATTYQVMSPGDAAMELADELSHAFSIQP
ncbi:MAG: MbnP family protein [Bacteroidota bacterium]